MKTLFIAYIAFSVTMLMSLGDEVSPKALVGKAIEGHFENGLSIYFCNKHRAIVLIEYSIPYLTNECILLPAGRR